MIARAAENLYPNSQGNWKKNLSLSTGYRKDTVSTSGDYKGGTSSCNLLFLCFSTVALYHVDMESFEVLNGWYL